MFTLKNVCTLLMGVLSLILTAPAGWAAITFVGQVQNTTCATSTTCTVSPLSPTAGNFLVLVSQGTNVAPTSVADSSTAAWTAVDNNNMWYIPAVGSGVTSVTATYPNATNTHVVLNVFEFSTGGATLTADVYSSTASGTSTTATSNSITTTNTNTNSLMISDVVDLDGTDVTYTTVSSGWSSAVTTCSSGNICMGNAYRAGYTAGAYTYQASISVSVTWYSFLYSFKEAVAAGGAPVVRRRGAP